MPSDCEPGLEVPLATLATSRADAPGSSSSNKEQSSITRLTPIAIRIGETDTFCLSGLGPQTIEPAPRFGNPSATPIVDACVDDVCLFLSFNENGCEKRFMILLGEDEWSADSCRVSGS